MNDDGLPGNEHRSQAITLSRPFRFEMVAWHADVPNRKMEPLDVSPAHLYTQFGNVEVLHFTVFEQRHKDFGFRCGDHIQVRREVAFP